MEGNTDLQQSNKGELKFQTQVMERPETNWLSGVKDRFRRVFKKEAGVEPNIKIDIYYSPHRSAEDIAGLEDQLKKADIFIPENFGCLPEYLNALRNLSSRKVTPEEVMQEWGDMSNKYSYFRDKKFFEIIHKFKKPITFIDIPANHSLVIREAENKIPKIEFGSDFGQAINSTREYVKNVAVLQIEREAYMLEQLQPRIQELLKIHPELRRKRELNILLSIGDAHTLLYRNLKEDYHTTRQFSRNPVVFPYREEAMRRFMQNRPVDDDLAARVLSERLLTKSDWDRFRTNDSIRDAIEVRTQLSKTKISFDELKKIFEDAHNLKEWADMFAKVPKKQEKASAVGN